MIKLLIHFTAQELEKSFDRESPDWPIRTQDLYEIRHNDVTIGTLRRNSLYSVSSLFIFLNKIKT